MKYVWTAFASAVGTLGGKLIDEKVIKKHNKLVNQSTEAKKVE
jgi:hypothetical protein